MNAFWGLTRNDLMLFFSDRRAVLMSFIAPVVLGGFFGYVFGGVPSGNTGSIEVLVADQAQDAVSREIVRQLGEEKQLTVKASSAEEARAAVRKGDAPVAVVLPANFGEAAAQALFTRQTKPALGVLFDPSRQTEASMVQGILTGAVMQAVSQEAFAGNTGRKMVDRAITLLPSATDLTGDQKQTLTELLRRVQRLNESGKSSPAAGGLAIPFKTKQEAITAQVGVVYNSYAHSFGGFAIQFMMFMGIDTGIGLLDLRRRGLWRRFLAAPLSKSVLLASRAFSAMLIGLTILFVVFSVAALVFGVRVEGSMLGLVGVCAALSLMTAAYGLLVAALGKTPEAARGLSIFATLILVMLSGAWVPSFLFPAWLQRFTQVLPTRWAMDGLDGTIWRGMSFGDALAPIAFVLAGAALFGAIAVWRFRWTAD